MVMFGAKIMLLEVKRRVWILDIFWRRSFQDWIWGVIKREESKRMEFIGPQMENTGAGACLEEDQKYSLDLLNERCLLDTKAEVWKGN